LAFSLAETSGKSEASSGDALFHNAKEIGKITSLGSYLTNGNFLGIAMIRQELTEEKSTLALAADSLPMIEQKALPTTIL
jgi:hypothetical protein